MRKRWLVAVLLAAAACGRDGAQADRGEPPSATPNGGMAADTAAPDMTGPEGTRVGQ